MIRHVLLIIVILFNSDIASGFENPFKGMFDNKEETKKKEDAVGKEDKKYFDIKTDGKNGGSIVKSDKEESKYIQIKNTDDSEPKREEEKTENQSSQPPHGDEVENPISSQEEEDNLKKSLRVLMLNGYVFMTKGEYHEAINLFSDVLKAEPNNLNALNNIGLCYLRLGMLRDAEHLFLGIIENDPSYYRAYNNLGVIYEKEGRFLDAISYYATSAKISPEQPDLYLRIAKSYEEIHKEKEAGIALDTVIKRYPEHPLANYRIGLFYLKQGKREDGLDYLRRFMDRSASDPSKHIKEREYVISVLNKGG
jgi:tetratricopeptide (TPR) repeat protein